MKGAWTLALRGLRRNRRRTLATGLAIALGFGGLLLLTGYLVRVDRYLRTVAIFVQHTGHLSVYEQDGLELHHVDPIAHSLDPQQQARLVEALADEPGVERVVPYLLGTGLIGNGCKSVPFLARGVDPALERWVREHPTVRAVAPELSRPLQGQALAEADALPSPVVLSQGLARALGKTRVHQQIADDEPPAFIEDCEADDVLERLAADANVQLAANTDDGSFYALDGEVVGHDSTGRTETENNSVLLPLSTLQELYDTERITYLAVFLDDPSDVARRAAQLQARLREQGLPVSVYAYDDGAVSPYYVGAAGFLRVMAGFIAIVVFAVVSLSILNTMTLGIIERTRELATLRAIGFTRRQALGLFVREGVLLTAPALAIGALAALGIAALVATQDIRTTPPGVPGSMQLLITPTPALALALALVILLLATIATVVATRSRTRRTIVNLLTARTE